MAFPEDRVYSRTHEWVLISGDAATIGITDYAQEQLGDVVFVELPAVGATFEEGDAFGNIESVKAVSEIFAPVAGEVTEVNTNLENGPELINQEPFTGGWLLKLRVAPGAADTLMNAAAYETFVAEEGSH